MAKWRRNRSLPRRWQRNRLIQQYGGQCYLCGEPFISAKDITIDHWQPLSKGGADDIENYRLAHLDCNNLKADMSPVEFQAFQDGKIAFED